MRRRYFLIITLSIMMIFSQSIQTISPISSEEINTHDVKILVLMDFAFGANYLHMLNQFEEYGWSVDTAGPSETITGCQYNDVEFDVDFLFSEISDITSYHCVNIVPGSSHVSLMDNQDSILDKIKTASDAGVIISAWCKAVRVLAAADVINGKNVTGSGDFASEYIAAGANFYSNFPPIISGNIVTVSSTQMYLQEMYIAMTQAIGCYENNPPILGAVEVIAFENLSRLLIVNLNDESGISEVKAKLHLISSDADPPPPSTMTLTLLDPEMDNNYSVIFYQQYHGFYYVDLEVLDIFQNEFTYTNITTIEVGAVSTVESSDSTKTSLDFLIAIISLPVFSGIIVIIRKKKNS